ncbi:sporangia induced predicted protein [Phytophthora infestans T30-4]|uniref:Uncharacterized protein n=2 Tax=Phytophthora infestans TaxID=4787 RepID=D0N7Q4_PHYIT|nr:sporangia induced predicted protein [Phytophthora infestans T30-4]EEY53603.1 sporangia induced predicted protein [Phytophthora infestans T30-4]KAF4038004.1 CCDC81 eukaryotic HU domain 2 [Phytophthora infestans]KAF4140697.1 CCDC81 eukaryotic HU domain 2 [Phytophthora infestans]|eukprot:XP_002905221.1 sporangia induced predicted protein [Phytophthora infestans T30-4]
MSLYTLKHLLNDCSTQLSRTKFAAEKNRETLESVWRAFNDWIESRFNQGKGVHVATFATITWETFTNSRNQPKLRPIFFLSDTFIKTYTLSQKRPPLPSANLASMEDINFTKIAIKFSRSLTKDLVFCAIRDMVQKIGSVASTGLPMSIEFNFGRLIAKNRSISMLFDPLKFPRALEDHIARSMISSPPSTVGNLDDFDISPEDMNDYSDAVSTPGKNEGVARGAAMDIAFSTDDQEALPTNRSDPDNIIGTDVSIEKELQMYDALLSPGSAKSDSSAKHCVMESAFKRHISKMANDVDLEAKYAFDLLLQQRRDLDTVALENKMRRLCAEDLQRHIQMQMQQREDVIASEKSQRRMVDPKACTFFSESERTRQGYDDQRYQNRVREKLKHQLQDQISNKEQDRIHSKQKLLQDDRKFLRRVRNELEAIEKKQVQDREELRKVLTGSWNRDSGMKKLVEVRKKQKAAEQIHREGVLIIPTPRDHFPMLLKPSTPRVCIARQVNDDYSVGFDIRSTCGD